eukprot:m.10248 g.10248  ORF g.10248 m.10248 type:complete len:63 (+) comp3637_c0_seq1:902-1090(+)
MSDIFTCMLSSPVPVLPPFLLEHHHIFIAASLLTHPSINQPTTKQHNANNYQKTTKQLPNNY